MARKACGTNPAWAAGPGVAGAAVRNGLLAGRSTDGFPVLHIQRKTGLDNLDLLHAVEVRMKVSAGKEISLMMDGAEKVDIAEQKRRAASFPWVVKTRLRPGNEIQTYTLTSPGPLPLSRLRHLMIRPTDAAQATFAIESVRVVSRKAGKPPRPR